MTNIIKYSVSVYFCLGLLSNLWAQDTAQTEEKVYQLYEVTKQASFKGGETEFHMFISQHLEYPAAALENNVSGRVMLVFIVERDGRITNVQAANKNKVGFGCEEAAIAVIKKTDGMWNPAYVKDKPVRMEFRLPLRFEADEPKKSRKKKRNDLDLLRN